MKRRTFLKNTLAVTATGAAIGSGLVPSMAFADEEKANPFKAKSLEEALKAAGITDLEESDEVMVKAPDLAENAAVVPVQVKSSLEGVSEIRIFVENNPTPHAASFTLGEGAKALVKCRFKMGKSSDVIGVVKVGDKYFSAKKAVKVTKGGCGG
ncbi:MAG: thiosulfate oxidation carrier protein SoxY [Leucothrix sp.]